MNKIKNAILSRAVATGGDASPHAPSMLTPFSLPYKVLFCVRLLDLGRPLPPRSSTFLDVFFILNGMNVNSNIR
jgi:hypothetical protein